MAIIKEWIQIENHPWDMSPNNIDRMTGELITPDPAQPGKPAKNSVRQIKDALILRRYKPTQQPDGSDAWTQPDDRRINPWDLNEPDPSVTHGTIPGPVLECNVGDELEIHFRNMDMRHKDPDNPGSDLLPPAQRAHSLHPHGIVFLTMYDGSFPLTPPDTGQPIPTAELAPWAALRATGSKQGDRVPPGSSFIYRWSTQGWPSTAGVWLYHDHSVCDDHNVLLGAIGFLVIHNPNDPDDVIDQDLPPGGPNGPLVVADGSGTRRFVKPPGKALYLQLFHELEGGGMAINGRSWLGNTPTLVGGLNTRMRFGLIGMNMGAFHTFHLHGHRWVVPGPSGSKVGGDVPPPGSGVQTSPMNQGVSQFEDTRVFGPANSFVFTINQGSFMGPPLGGGAIGEWHMHCHVLGHMMGGMMGSLLIVQDNQTFTELPVGMPCPTDSPGSGTGSVAVSIQDNKFVGPDGTSMVMINAGQTVQWTNHGGDDHTVSSNKASGQTFTCTPVSTEIFESGTLHPGDTFPHTFNQTGTFAYHCELHGCHMSGTVMVM